MKDRDKPRRAPWEWMRDYFYINENGSYRAPSSNEERETKRLGRISGLSYKVKRYLSMLEQKLPIPYRQRPNDSSLAEWIRHCKRTGLYEQGKLLYEKGGINLDALPEELMVSVEEDYQVCARMLARDRSEAKGSAKRRRSSLQ